MIGCSLVLATGALAKPDENAPGKKKKKQQQQAEGGAPQQAAPRANQGRPDRPPRADRQAKPGNEARPAQDRKAMRKEPAADSATAKPKMARPATSDNSAETNVQDNNDANGTRRGKQMKKERDAAKEARPADKAAASDASTETSTAAQVNVGNRPGKKANARAKKPDPQVVQKVKAEHVNFKAKPKPEKVPAVTFNESYRITGAQHWTGPQYEVFRTYRPARHDHGWYRSRYNRIEIIAGGAYFFNNGYWYPAWGYDPAYQYYAYDAPIYVGTQALPPDRVIADVQAILQEQGYYRGEVDGLLGPLTREALTEYQTDNGLYATATIDEPTLQSLDLG